MIIRKFDYKSVGIFCVLAIPIHKSTLKAQSVSETTPPENQIQTDIQVVVTAARGAGQNPLDVPQSITAITSREIEERPNTTDLDNALRRIPGISLAPAEGAPNYFQEGFTVRGLGAQRVLTLTDGIRQAGQGIGYGGGNLSLYDVFSVESIEVLKGPSSVLYGTDAFGGVINVITRQPKRRDEFGANASIRSIFDSSYDALRHGGWFDIGGPGFGIAAGGSWSDFDEPNLPNSYPPRSGSYENWNAWGKLDTFFNDNLKLRFHGAITRNTNVLVTNQKITLPCIRALRQGITPGVLIPGNAVVNPISTPPFNAVAGQFFQAAPDIYFPVADGSTRNVTAPLYLTFPLYQRTLAGINLEYENADAPLEYAKAEFAWQQIRRQFLRKSLFFEDITLGPIGPVSTSEVLTDDEVNTYELNFQARINWATDNKLIAGLDFGYDTSYLPEREVRRVLANPNSNPVFAGPFLPDQTIIGKRIIPPFDLQNFFFPGFDGRTPIGPLSSSTAAEGSRRSFERVRADAQQFRFGAYAQNTTTLLDGKLDITPAVRADYFTVSDSISNTSDDAFGLSGSLSALYRWTDQISSYGIVASGFRVPDLGERYQRGVVNIGGPNLVIGKPGLDPERSYSAEIGTKAIASNFTFEIAGYLNYIADYIGERKLGIVEGFQTSQYDNVGDVTLYGVEIGGSYTFFEKLTLYANAARTFTERADLVRVPDWIFNYGVEWRKRVELNWLQSYFARLEGRSVMDFEDQTAAANATALGKPAKSPKGGFPTLKGYTKFGVSAGLDFAESRYGQFRIVAGIDNIFDERYEEPFFLQQQPGRSYYISGEWRF
jgi:outer membrane receptor protein involved in Fe transport